MPSTLNNIIRSWFRHLFWILLIKMYVITILMFFHSGLSILYTPWLTWPKTLLKLYDFIILKDIAIKIFKKFISILWNLLKYRCVFFFIILFFRPVHSKILSQDKRKKGLYVYVYSFFYLWFFLFFFQPSKQVFLKTFN